MTYKSLLTFIAVDQPVDSLDRAIEFASATEAHLDVVVLGAYHSPPVVMHDVAPAVEWITMNNETTNNAGRMAEEIEKLMASKNISASVIAECDYPSRLEKIAARYALCVDAYVVTVSSLQKNECIKRGFTGTLFDAGCPVLLLPDEQSKISDMSKVAVAWNGKVEASKAVRNAQPLLADAEKINIIIIDPVEENVGQHPGSDLAAHLSRYVDNVAVDVLASGGLGVSEKLMQRTADIGANLLIMGGYGHTRFREWLLGGATEEMLQQAKIPVLMVH